jgi:hypothetical protein
MDAFAKKLILAWFFGVGIVLLPMLAAAHFWK